MKWKLTQLAALSATMLVPFIITAQENPDSIASAGKGKSILCPVSNRSLLKKTKCSP